MMTTSEISARLAVPQAYRKMEPKIDMLTLAELTELLRAHGMKVGQATLADGIEQGVYPFAVCIKRKTRVFEIYTALVYKWIAERLVPKEQTPHG
jgi:hypothetical protein